MQVLMSKGFLSYSRKYQDEVVTHAFLEFRKGSGKFGVSAWILFCQEMLSHGYVVTLKETHNTYSKYVKVLGINDDTFLVRFSNHKPNKSREAAGHCDFFVGVSNFTVTTWQDAVEATLQHFSEGI